MLATVAVWNPLAVAAFKGFQFPADASAATRRDQYSGINLIHQAPKICAGILVVDLEVAAVRTDRTRVANLIVGWISIGRKFRKERNNVIAKLCPILTLPAVSILGGVLAPGAQHFVSRWPIPGYHQRVVARFALCISEVHGRMNDDKGHYPGSYPAAVLEKFSVR